MEGYRFENNVLCVEKGIEVILSESFAGRQDIEKIVLSDTVKDIGAVAFGECTNLREVVFESENNIERIGDGTFILCEKLNEFNFGSKLERIGEMAFWGSGLKKADIPESVKVIEDTAFWACNNLIEFNVFNKDCIIGKDVIGDCDNLKEGFVACGYPDGNYYNHMDELSYAMLWLSRPEGHLEKTRERAMNFIRNNEILIMEKILENNNTPAMTGLVKTGLLNIESVDKYIEKAGRRNLIEITNLLLEIKRDNKKDDLKEFEL